MIRNPLFSKAAVLSLQRQGAKMQSLLSQTARACWHWFLSLGGLGVFFNQSASGVQQFFAVKAFFVHVLHPFLLDCRPKVGIKNGL